MLGDMDDEYYKLTAELDAREVLRYLNSLGIHNISGEVLKYFITDLKKYIKYDLQQKYENNRGQDNIDWAERLHCASTFSSRIRSQTQDQKPDKCTRDCQMRRKPLHVRNIHSAPNIRQDKALTVDKPLRRACSCVRVEKRVESALSQTKPTTATTLSNNLIKVPKAPVKKKCDPVSLYHYYTTLWEKYKSNVPGENNWSELRWNVRQKMAGCTIPPTQSKVSTAISKPDK